MNMTAFELVRRASKVTESIGDAECAKWLMKHRATELLEAHPGESTLYQYSWDCTPLRTRKCIKIRRKPCQRISISDTRVYGAADIRDDGASRRLYDRRAEISRSCTEDRVQR
eukprot:5980363-Amphidinium_carterae.1